MKSLTDVLQSKKLAEILPKESADFHYVRNTHDFMGNPVDGKWSHPKYGNPNSQHAHYVVQNFSSYEIIPCWSFAALLSVLPYPEIWQDNSTNRWACSSLIKDTEYLWESENLVDSCVEVIIKLHKQKLL